MRGGGGRAGADEAAAGAGAKAMGGGEDGGRTLRHGEREGRTAAMRALRRTHRPCRSQRARGCVESASHAPAAPHSSLRISKTWSVMAL